MKNSDEGTNGAGQLAKPNPLATISERKLKANRENARKSTGPKTPRGKAFSRRNAIKHGLFFRSVTDSEALGENVQEYEDLLNGLRDQYQPVGRAEEVEVERIALCYWRLKRAWRHENAVNLVARRDLGNRELAEQRDYCQERDKEEQAIILQLQSAKKEIEDTGEISQELKRRIFSLVPGVEGLWQALDKNTQELIEELSRSKKRLAKLSPGMRFRVVALSTVAKLTAYFEQVGKRRWTNVVELPLDNMPFRIATLSIDFFVTGRPSTGALLGLSTDLSACRDAVAASGFAKRLIVSSNRNPYRPYAPAPKPPFRCRARVLATQQAS